MTEITGELLAKLEQLSTETHMPLEKRLIDMAVWFHANRDRIPKENVKIRLDFLEKSFDIFLEMTAMLVERMQLAEGRRKSQSLWTPAGMSAKGDMTRFG